MSIRTSTQTEQLDEAFAKAQAKFEAAVKSNTNPAFRSKYADVSSIIDATLEHLNAEGIGLRQHPSLEYKQVGEGVEAYVTVTTRLTYKGQWEESDLSLPAVQRDRFDAQSCGSALTYACRYALQGILVVRREDDDGNAATGRGTHEEAQAVGKAKVEALKAAKAQQDPSKGPDQLCCYPAGDGFEVTGMPEVMDTHKELLLAYGKRGRENGKPAGFVTMTAEGLDAFKHEFCDNRKGILVSMKARKIADDAVKLKEAM